MKTTEHFKHASLFSGIGGFDLAAEWMGWENMFHCEWNEFGQKVLKYYWPKAITYGDITKTDFTIHRGTIDILTGGFPCQPYSMAGKRLGKKDERHLWPEMLRAIREIQPTWVVGENVSGLVNWNGGMVFDEVQADLEAEGYEVIPFLLPACGVNAPHKRERVWFVAYSASNRREWGRSGIETEKGLQQGSESTGKLEGRFEGLRIQSTIANSTSVQNIGRRQIRFQPESSGIDVERITPDPTSEGRKEREQGNGFTDSEENKAGVDGGFERLSDLRDVTDTSNKGLQRGKVNGGTGKIRQDRNKQLTRPLPSTWQNFPTQSPLRSRNDGVSTRLVGITFPKFRNESIKAYGNAIVPQVVFQIFKAIAEANSMALITPERKVG